MGKSQKIQDAISKDQEFNAFLKQRQNESLPIIEENRRRLDERITDFHRETPSGYITIAEGEKWEYKTATQQTVNLVLDTIHLAMKQEKKKVAAELQLHSDQGFQYTSQAYFKLTQQYGITPSMSRRGDPYDNAMAENFFSNPSGFCRSK